MFKKKDNKGFSIIEVLIVLAIAGLIMLVVFLAVPALQRSARNNSRSTDAQKFSAAVTQCLANNNGVQTNCATYTSAGGNGVQWNPTVDGGQLTGIPLYGAAPPLAPVSAAAAGGAAATDALTGITWRFGYRCNGAVATAATVREFVVIYNTEGASASANPACISS